MKTYRDTMADAYDRWLDDYVEPDEDEGPEHVWFEDEREYEAAALVGINRNGLEVCGE